VLTRPDGGEAFISASAAIPARERRFNEAAMRDTLERLSASGSSQP
jgi:hypothetical protein